MKTYWAQLVPCLAKLDFLPDGINIGKGETTQGNHYGFGGRSLCGQCGLVIDLDAAEQLNQPITMDHCLACWQIVFLWDQLRLVGLYWPRAAF